MLRASLGTTLAFLGVLGAVAAGSLTANASPAAEPPADTFTVVSAGNSAPNQLTVVVDSPSTITGLTASLIRGTAVTIGTDDVYDVALTPSSSIADPNDSTQTQTTWVATIPLGTSPSGVALGIYSVNLTATYSDTTTSKLTDAGPFGFVVRETVTLTASRTNLNFVNPSTTLSGTVTLTNPDGTADTDYTGLSASLIVNGDGVLDNLPVSSTGTFSLSLTPSKSESVVVYAQGPGVPGSGSDPVHLTVTDTTPTLTLKVNPVTETYGKTATVTGTLTYMSGSTSEPVADQKIWIGTNEQYGQNDPVATGTTGEDGTFSITLPKEQTGTTLYVGSTDQTDLSATAVPLTLNVVNPTVISSFKVSLSQSWGLSVSGCLGFDSGNTAQRFHHTSGLTVQYASSAKGPWKNLFRISGNEPDRPCGTGGIKFSGSATAPENYAYYRVAYAGTTGATSYAATDSNAVLAWKYADRITGFKASPTVVNAGGKLTITGTLQYYNRGWHNYSGQTIWIVLHPKGSSPTWFAMVTVRTNSKGQFSATFKDPGSATWEAVFEGNNNNGVGHLAVGSPEVYVRLK